MPLIDGYLGEDLIVYRGLQKGGYIGRGFRLEMPDIENASADFLNELEDSLRVLIAGIREDARMQFLWTVDSDYRTELMAYKRATDEKADNDWARRQRDERFVRYWEKMESHELRKEQLYIFVTSKVDTSVIPSGMARAKQYEYLLSAADKEMQLYYEVIDQIISGVGGQVFPMGDMEHFEAFYKFFNPDVTELPEVDYEDYFVRDATIAENCFNGEAAPLEAPDYGFYHAGYYHGLLTMKSLPKGTTMGMIGLLTGLSMMNYSITVNVQPVDIQKELEKAESEAEKLQTALTGTGKNKSKLRMQNALHKKQEVIARLMHNQMVPYRAQWIIRAWDQTKEGLRAKMNALRSSISKLDGAKPYDPSFAVSARNYYYASMPGWCWDRYNDYTHYIEDANLVNLLPVTATAIGHLDEAEAIYDGDNGNLVGLRTFAGSGSSETPQHGLMLGMSGAGKSVNTIDLLTQTDPYFDYTVIVEEGLSYGIFTQTYGVRPIILQPNGTLTFNYLDTNGLPLSGMQVSNATALVQLMVGLSADDDKNKAREARIANILNLLYSDTYENWKNENQDRLEEVSRHAMALQKWMVEKMPPGSTFIDAFSEFRELKTTDPGRVEEELQSFDSGEVLKFSREKGEELVKSLAFSYMSREEVPRHSQLYELLQMEGAGRGKNSEEMAYLADMVLPWTETGRYGAILDGPSNVDIGAKVAHFELGYIPESAADLRTVAAFLITNQARNEVMTRPRGLRKRIVLEELSAFLTIPNGERITREFYERMRKYNTWVFSIIQQYSRFRDSAVRSSVMGNSRLCVLLKQRDRVDLENICETFPLPDATMNSIMNFPEPAKQKGEKFSSMVYYAVEDRRPLIATARNYANPEMIYCSSSTGSDFEKRAKELSGEENIVDGIIKYADPDKTKENKELELATI